MEIKHLKSSVTLFFELNTIGSFLGLCILVVQRTAKLPEVKVGGLEKDEKCG